MSQQAKNLIAQARTHGWTRLDLGNCNLTDLQTQVPELFELQQLEELVLSNVWREWNDITQEWEEKKSQNTGQTNKLSQLPQAMAQLKYLKVLVCGGGSEGSWGISDISVLQSLTQLTTLDLINNQIRDIGALQFLTQLTKLDLSLNPINDIGALQFLTQLTTLYLWRNKISDIGVLQSLTQLTTLDLRSNQISDIGVLQSLTQLTTLDLSFNKISDIGVLQSLTQLTTLDLSFNKITKLENLDKLPNLQQLFIGSNQITQLENLDKLPNLQELNIGGNKITQLENLDKLPNLQKLVISHNQITKLENLDKLPNLQQLDIWSNKITQLENLDKLPNLQKLNISENQITKLENLDKLPNLQQLNIRHNQITSNIDLAFLSRFPQLNYLDIEINPLGNIPPEVVQGMNCLADLRRYLLDLEEGGQPNNEVKVLLIGNGNVGKTQVAKRLELQDSFVFDTQHNSTHAISLLQRQLPCRSLPIEGLLLNLWDFGGQDLYHATHRLFMRTRALFLLVWDKTSEADPHHTWQGHDYKNEKLLYWLSYAQYFGEHSPIIVVQNKIDATAGLKDPYPEPAQNELKKLYPAINDFMELSAKTGDEFEVLEDVIAEVFELNPTLEADLLNKKLPKTWVQVRNRIREEQAKPNGLTDIAFATFEQWCREAKIPASAQLLARFLHDTGVIYYQGNYFAGRIIIDQAWAISAVYKILDRKTSCYKSVKRRKGKLSYTDVCKIWQAHSDKERELFLNFMLSSELCFETTLNKKYDTPLQDRTFVVPQLLPEQEPDYMLTYQQGRQANQQKPFEYRFLPSVFIQRFIIKAHNFSDEQYMWQQGIGLVYNEGCAIVRASYAPSYSITISYNTAALQNGLLQAIEEELQALENEDKNIPHPEHKKKGFDVLSLFIKQTMNHKQHLQQLVAQGKLKQAITELLDATQQNGQSDLHDTIIQLSGRFHENEGDKHNDVVSVDNYKLELNKIRNALLSYLNEYQPNGSFVFTPQGDNNTQPVPNSTEKQTTPPKATCQTVLFMCASPSDVANVLNFGAEFEKIKQALITSPNRDKFDIKIETSVKYDNIQRLLLQHQPSVLHISMHNSLTDGFLFEKADGIRIALSDQQLSSMIQVGTEGHLPNLIVLSACNSKTHADAVKPYTTHLIAMNDFISDEAAAYYASEFYKLYFDTQNIKTAHNGAINNLRANNSLTDNQKSALIPYIAK